MRKLLATISALVLLSPVSAFAAATLERTPSGSEFSQTSVTIHITWEGTEPGWNDNTPVSIVFAEADPCPALASHPLWNEDYQGIVGAEVDSAPLNGGDLTETFTGLPVCSYSGIELGEPTFSNGISLTDVGGGDVWTITAAVSAGIFAIPLTFVPTMGANVTETLAADGFSAVAVYAIAIMVIFWVITQTIGVIRSPADRERFDVKRFRAEADRIEHDYRDLRRFSEGFGKIGDEYREKK